MFYLFDCFILLSVLKWLFITYVCFHIYFGTFFFLMSLQCLVYINALFDLYCDAALYIGG